MEKKQNEKTKHIYYTINKPILEKDEIQKKSNQKRKLSNGPKPITNFTATKQLKGCEKETSILRKITDAGRDNIRKRGRPSKR